MKKERKLILFGIVAVILLISSSLVLKADGSNDSLSQDYEGQLIALNSVIAGLKDLVFDNKTLLDLNSCKDNVGITEYYIQSKNFESAKNKIEEMNLCVNLVKNKIKGENTPLLESNSQVSWSWIFVTVVIVFFMVFIFFEVLYKARGKNNLAGFIKKESDDTEKRKEVELEKRSIHEHIESVRRKIERININPAEENNSMEGLQHNPDDHFQLAKSRVEEFRKSGYSNREIRDIFLSNSWTDDEIDRIM